MSEYKGATWHIEKKIIQDYCLKVKADTEKEALDIADRTPLEDWEDGGGDYQLEAFIYEVPKKTQSILSDTHEN